MYVGLDLNNLPCCVGRWFSPGTPVSPTSENDIFHHHHNDRFYMTLAVAEELGIISKWNDAKKDDIISSGGGEGVGIDIISISSFIIFLASQ